MAEPQNLKLAVCLFDDVTILDYQGPVELFGFLQPKYRKLEGFPPSPAYTIDLCFLGESIRPITASSGPDVTPNRTFDSVKEGEQFDIILVPGGMGSFPGRVSVSLLEFLKRQAPGVKYMLSVCTGSWILAQAGLLDGRKATTNKYSLKLIREKTKQQPITWVAKARWVVDGNYWTSSGVTAGMDMASAFLEQLVGKKITRAILGVIELTAKEQGEDEFADVYNLE